MVVEVGLAQSLVLATLANFSFMKLFRSALRVALLKALGATRGLLGCMARAVEKAA